jgi:hypothetical protein
MTATAVYQPSTTPTTGPSRVPAAAGWTFVAVWIAGLTAFPAGPPIDAAAGEAAGFYADHGAATALQSVLVHGLAPIALVVVLFALPVTGAARQVLRAAGIAGVGLSFLQLGLGLGRSAVAGTASASTVDSLVETINRTDGLKMLAFAIVIVAAAGLPRHPRLRRLGAITAVALAASAAGYLLLDPTLGLAAFASLPLLLVWTAAAGTIAARSR